MNVAIIPARGGSKRIPKKNIVTIGGKPMIYWPIKAALDSKLFDHIIVSTDDDEISQAALNCGAEVPFTRPKELSDDFTGIKEVTKHALNWLDDKGIKVNYCCCILATAVFTIKEDLIFSLEQLKDHNKDIAFSVTEHLSPLQRSFKINKEGVIELFWPEAIKERSQDLEKTFHDAGQFYWGTREAFTISDAEIISEHSLPIIIPNYRVQDIDTDDDLMLAKSKFNLLNRSQ
jgi:pseudaminic acid cytidylyltransferase